MTAHLKENTRLKSPPFLRAQLNGQSRKTIQLPTRVHQELRTCGFSYAPSAEVSVPPHLDRALRKLLVEIEEMPPDPHAAEGNRDRRYGKFILYPWSKKMQPWPIHTYQQSASLNPEASGEARMLPPLTLTIKNNPFLHKLTFADFAATPFDDDARQYPMAVNVHIIKMKARPGAPGTSSPNKLHKDGEPFTFVHLLKRKNISGGETVVADNDMRTLFTTTLEETLDTVVVRDDAVFHQVKEVFVLPGIPEGYRIALLIDFTPLKPAVTQYAVEA